MAGIKSDNDRRPARGVRDSARKGDIGKLADSRDSRGPDTGEPLEREVCPPGRKRRKRDQLGESFDDDLTR